MPIALSTIRDIIRFCGKACEETMNATLGVRIAMFACKISLIRLRATAGG